MLDHVPTTSPTTLQEPEWIINGQGELTYLGNRGEIRMPYVGWMICDPPFADGFHYGRTLCLQQDNDTWDLLTTHEFTTRIDQYLPADLSVEDQGAWGHEFLFRWVMTWHFQPLLDEEAQTSDEGEAVGESHRTMN